MGLVDNLNGKQEANLHNKLCEDFGSSRFRGVATRYGLLYLPTKMPS